MMQEKGYLQIIFFSMLLFILVLCHTFSQAEDVTLGDDMSVGLPIGGGGEEVDLDLCPHGVRVIKMFMEAWEKKDYPVMYDLLEDKSKADYPYEEAKFDFQFLEFKPYKISAIRKNGDNYDFMMTYGDWKYGDKDTKKIVIDGNSFKIIMFRRGTPFKKSAASYF